MSQPGRRRRKAKLGTPAAVVLTRKDWIWLSSCLAGVGVVFFGWLAFEFHLSHEASLRHTLSRWRAEYHLTEEQERRIRAEEERFHGSANPLTRPRRTPEEAEMHRLAVGHLMNSEDGERFLAQRKPAAGGSTKQTQSATDGCANLHP